MKDKKTLGQAMQTQVKRRSVLKAGAAGVAGGMLLPGTARVALADDKKPLGAWPAGAEGDSVFVGLTVDLTGPYKSEEHTSELQSRENLVCRLLLEKKKNNNNYQLALMQSS